MLIPNKLKTGDTIGIVSPSQAILPEKRIELENGIKALENLGFKTVLGKNALNIKDYSAGTPEEKANDINSMFADNEIKAIICSSGGNTANSCLPLLDWKTMEKNPKIFLGISDITVLLNAINTKTGLITFHGHNVCGFGRTQKEYDKKEFSERLAQGKTGAINKNSEWKTIREGIGKGKLLGGNLNCLLKLAGTEFFPDFSNSILFIEAYKITPAECDFMLHQLKQLRVFEKINGAIIGYVYGLQAAEEKLKQMEEILLETTKEYDFPILKCNDFGHNCSNTILPVGVKTIINAGKKELEITEKYLE